MFCWSMSLGLSKRKGQVRDPFPYITRLLIKYLGVVLDDEAKNIIEQGKEIKDAPRQDAPRKEDIVQE